MRAKSLAKDPLLSGTLYEEEIRIEREAVNSGVDRYHRLKNEAIERGEGASLKPIERLMLHWMEPLVGLIKEEQAKVKRSARAQVAGRNVYGPVIASLDAERLAATAMFTALSLSVAEPGGVKYRRMTNEIGRAVLAEHNLDLFRKHERERLTELTNKFRNVTPHRLNWWARKHLEDPVVTRTAMISVGGALFGMLMDSAMIGDYEDGKLTDAFWHKVKREGRRQVGYAGLTDAAFEVIDKGHHQRQFMRPQYQFMVHPPAPWTRTTEGGYTCIRTPFMARPYREQKRALHNADLSKPYALLNSLNRNGAMEVDGFILEVLNEIGQQGGRAAGVPSMDDIPKPGRPDEFESEEDEKKWRGQAAQTYKDNIILRAQRYEFWQQVSVARKFLGRPVWTPHQLDFRGRAYPIPQILNHQGNDVSRGMLRFADAKRLDVRGYRWLMIHAANCWGYDKVSFSERVEWAQDYVKRTGADAWTKCPEAAIEAYDEWKSADKPVQFLSAVRALCNMEHARHCMVQMDGSCNGLQWYAALGRDRQGASVVNMLPSDKPSDIYTDVCDRVSERVRADINRGNPLAKLVAPTLSRKLVKQPVMTTTYGVTGVGMREQIVRQLWDAGHQRNRETYDMSRYLVEVIQAAIADTCTQATQIMTWLRSTAATIVVEAKDTVRWTSPAGVPVVQPYRAFNTLKIKTIHGIVNTRADDIDSPPKLGKQVDGFPPNYVHSLDASHMLLTAKACEEAGVAFAGVHDCYLTHAATADRLARITREQFVGLHEAYGLEDLHAELEATYGLELPRPPARGDYDIQAVLDSPYFFS